ncbi:phosphate propanoyltransferase [Pilibacter termitis]|uniref:Phosphate propanoyltransferase n=1 Tax=Pilibacter termitis TaxID=263852 RepID=A0A1T4MJT9_9ENTE|nr:phosphate propanoyltransferase [Pilibacter termitis]
MAIKEAVCQVLLEMKKEQIPIGISNRHVHLTEEDFKALFPNEKIEPLKPLKQPNEYASKSVVTLKGAKGEIERVRVLGPLRRQSQVEISKTDARTLGVNAPIRLSGDLKDASMITLCSENGEITIPAAIIAKRHIHMSFKEMEELGLNMGQAVKVRVTSKERTVVLEDVEIRAGENFVLEMHVDTDEANACDILPNTTGSLITE